MLRTHHIAALALTLFVANGIFEHIYRFSKESDLRYIAENCSRVKPEQARSIANLILYDPGFIHVYIFEQVPGAPSDGDFEAARRGSLSTFLCFPFVGCLTSPELGAACK